MSQEFCQWLKTELQARGWSQDDLARQTGISYGVIHDILNDYRTPDPELCAHIAKALRISPEIIFRRAGLIPAKRQR